MGTRTDGRGTAIAVVGGGPAGLAAAYRLSSLGLRPVVFEAGEHTGGLARSFDLWGQRVDLGAHLLQKHDPRIAKLWNELVGDEYDAVPRRTAVIVGDKKLAYPYQPLEVLRALGLADSARCLGSFAAARLRREFADDLESWVVRRFGRRLFEMFVRDYAEKLFGMAAGDLDSAFGPTLLGFKRHPSLLHVARASAKRHSRLTTNPIVRPHGGVGALMDALADAVLGRGGVIHCDCVVRRLTVSKHRVELETTRGDERFAHVVMTLPLPVVARLLPVPGPAQSRLRTMKSRNLLLTYLLVSPPPPFREQWLYVHTPALRVGRVANFRNWSESPQRSESPAILAAETWCDNADELWSAPENDVAALATREVSDSGILHSANVLDARVERLSRAFPVLARGDTSILAAAARHFTAVPNLTLTSRAEASINVGVHQSILLGFDAAERVVRETR